jgi:hypothetical protein
MTTAASRLFFFCLACLRGLFVLPAAFSSELSGPVRVISLSMTAMQRRAPDAVGRLLAFLESI